MIAISSFSKLLSQAVAKLPWGVQLGIVVVILLGAVLTIGSIAFSMRRGRKKRAHPRVVNDGDSHGDRYNGRILSRPPGCVCRPGGIAQI